MLWGCPRTCCWIDRCMLSKALMTTLFLAECCECPDCCDEALRFAAEEERRVRWVFPKSCCEKHPIREGLASVRYAVRGHRYYSGLAEVCAANKTALSHFSLQQKNTRGGGTCDRVKNPLGRDEMPLFDKFSLRKLRRPSKGSNSDSLLLLRSTTIKVSPYADVKAGGIRFKQIPLMLTRLLSFAAESSRYRCAMAASPSTKWSRVSFATQRFQSCISLSSSSSFSSSSSSSSPANALCSSGKG